MIEKLFEACKTCDFATIKNYQGEALNLETVNEKNQTLFDCFLDYYYILVDDRENELLFDQRSYNLKEFTDWYLKKGGKIIEPELNDTAFPSTVENVVNYGDAEVFRYLLINAPLKLSIKQKTTYSDFVVMDVRGGKLSKEAGTRFINLLK